MWKKCVLRNRHCCPGNSGWTMPALLCNGCDEEVNVGAKRVKPDNALAERSGCCGDDVVLSVDLTGWGIGIASGGEGTLRNRIDSCHGRLIFETNNQVNCGLFPPCPRLRLMRRRGITDGLWWFCASVIVGRSMTGMGELTPGVCKPIPCWRFGRARPIESAPWAVSA